MNKPEKRFIEVDEMELRSEGEDKQSYVVGLGIVYDKEVEIWPGFREKIRKGAFDKSLRSRDEIKSFFNHNAGQVLATTRSDPPLYLEDTEKGLRFKAPIPPTSYGNDLSVNLQRKNVRGSSFQFSVDDDGEILVIDEKGVIHREIISGTLYEIGPVTNRASTSTTASMRSAEEAFVECRRKLDKQAGDAAKEVEASAADLQLKRKKCDLYL